MRRSLLVTGANGDIGMAIYEQFVSDDRYNIFLHFRNRKSFKLVEQRIDLGRVTCLFADLGRLDEVEKMAAELPEIDILVNNAGVFKAQNFLETASRELQQMLTINYLAPLVLTHAVTKRMGRKGGMIINLSSGSGSHGGLLPSFGYAASKNGLNFMAQALDKELTPRGITVVTVVLRFVKTKMLDSYAGYYRSFVGEDLDLTNIDKRLHLNSPEDVALKIKEIIEGDAKPAGPVIEML